MAYHAKGDYDNAISDFSKVIDLAFDPDNEAYYPEYYTAYYRRGCAYIDKGDHDQADADFAKAKEIRNAQ